MDFKQLNEELKQILEGDVVSFADFKNRKTAERRKERSAEFLKQHGDELQAQLDKFNDSALVVTIDKIKVLWAEGPIKNPHYEPGEEFSYENFQEDLYARDYMNQIQEKYDKCEFEIFWTQNDGLYNQSMKMRVTIGGGREECNIFETFEMILDQKNDRRVMITNDPVKYNENYYKQLAKEYGIEPPVKENPLNDPIVKSYVRNTPQEVEVGDILECNWGYSMSLVDYYKVIERKKASIKLAKLETKIVSGDGGRGTCIPTDKTKPDQYVDGKLFRIGYKYDNKVVCSVNGHSCCYWDGKPGSFDTWD